MSALPVIEEQRNADTRTLGEQVLDVLMTDAPRTSVEIANMLGLTTDQVAGAVYALRGKGLARSERTTQNGKMVYLTWKVANPLPLRKREPIKPRNVLAASERVKHEDAVDRMLRGMAMADEGRQMMLDAVAEIEHGLNDAKWLMARLQQVIGGKS